MGKQDDTPSACRELAGEPLRARDRPDGWLLTDVLRGRHHVLDVGCGRGEVGAGWVPPASGSALDRELPGPLPAAGVTFVERDFLRHDAGPSDAVVCTAPLHPISPLGAAIDRAHRLRAPGGLLVADELDVDAPAPRSRSTSTTPGAAASPAAR